MIPTWLTRAFTTPLFPLGEQGVSLLWLIHVIGLLVAVSLLARLIKHFLREQLLLRLRIPEGRREAIATLSSLSLAALGYVLVVQGMGLDLGAIAVIVGALGVGLGFGLQDLTRNLSSGLTLLMEGKLKVGDLIEFNDINGAIKEISIRSTVISTFQGSEVNVPNTFITNNPVLNLNYSGTKGRLEVSIVVAHHSDVLEVTEILLQAALDEPFANVDPPPRVIFASQGEAGLKFLLWVWTSDVQNGLLIRSSLNYAIEQGLRERGVKLAGSPGLIHLMQPLSTPVDEQTDRQELVSRKPSRLLPLRELLPALLPFQGLHGRPLRELIASGARQSFMAGEVLIRQGDPSHYFHLVVSGCIDAIYETDRISRRLFSFRQGEFFGELPLLLEVPYPTSMRAAEDTTVFVIPHGGFRALLERHPEFARIITDAAARRRDVLDSYEESLRTRGFLAAQDVDSPLQWLRDNLLAILRS